MLNATELAEKLGEMYRQGDIKKEKKISIILFGIEFSEDLRNCKASIEDICNVAFKNVSTVKKGSYKSEVSEGMKLAKYVRLIKS